MHVTGTSETRFAHMHTQRIIQQTAKKPFSKMTVCMYVCMYACLPLRYMSICIYVGASVETRKTIRNGFMHGLMEKPLDFALHMCTCTIYFYRRWSEPSSKMCVFIYILRRSPQWPQGSPKECSGVMSSLIVFQCQTSNMSKKTTTKQSFIRTFKVETVKLICRG